MRAGELRAPLHPDDLQRIRTVRLSDHLRELIE
jgi:hypothetical protein